MVRDATSSEVAAALGVSAATVQKYARDGRIPFGETPGGHRRFDIEEVKAALGVAEQAAADESAHRSRGTALILTALDLEYDAVARCLPDRLPHRGKNGTRYEVGSFAGEYIDWTVAIAEIGTGNIGAAAETVSGINEFDPDIVFFVGVAGSLKDDVSHGAVVVADKVYEIHSGKAADDFHSRPVSFPTLHGLGQLVRQVRRKEWWTQDDAPEVQLKPIAAGEVVVASKTSPTYRRISERCNDAVAVDMESAGVYGAAHRAQRAVLAVRGISDMVADKAADADEKWQPRAAAHAAAFAYALLRWAHGDDLHLTPPSQLYVGEWARLLGRVPPPTAAAAERARDEKPDETYRLLEALQYSEDGGVGPARKVAALVDAPPTWLKSRGTTHLWVAIGEYAVAHDLHRYAVPAFKKAAAAGDERRGWWLARAGLAAAASGDVSRAESLLDEARNAGLEEPVYQVMTAAINEDAAGIIEAGRAAEGLEALIDVMRVQALASVGREEEALQLAHQSLEDHPSRGFTTGLAVLAAKLLIRRASVSNARGGAWDLDEAREMALRARDVRRRWGGPSDQAAAIAAAAAAEAGDLDGVLRIALPPPDGEATPAEAAHDDVKAKAAHAAVIRGRLDLARSLSDAIRDRSERLLVRASAAQTAGEEAEAVDLYLEASEAANVKDQQLRALVGLAETGVVPVPGLETLERDDAEAAEFVRAVSAYSRSEFEEAARRLRSLTNRHALDLLVDVYRSQNRIDDAVDALREGATRFGRPELRFRAAALLGSVGRFEDSLQEAQAVLLDVRPGGYLHGELRRLSIQAAARAGDGASMVKHARAAIREGHQASAIRWALVAGLYNQRQLDAARSELELADLRPRDEEEARLAIQLVVHGDSSEEAVEAVLDIADQFPNSEVVNAAAFGAVMQLSSELNEIEHAVVARMHTLTETFFNRWPDSSMVTRIDASDPANIVSYLKEQFAEPARRWESLCEDVAMCRLPYGFLAAARRRSISETLVTCAAGCIPLGAVSMEETDEHVQTAEEALESQVVADMTSLYIGGVVTPSSSGFMAVFTRILVPRSVLDDALEARDAFRLRASGTLGWDPASDRPVLVELDEDEIARRLKEAEKLLHKVRDSQVRELAHPREQDPRAEVVLAPVHLAKQHGAPLWTDDSVIRNVARSEGVESFGTIHLLAAMRRRGLLSDEDVREAIRSLMKSWVADVPFNAELLMEIGEATGWQGGPETLPLTRPSTWTNPTGALEVLRLGLNRCAKRNPKAVADWTYAACLGAYRSLPEGARMEAISTVVTAGFLELQGSPRFLPGLLDGARVLARKFHLEDPLETVATKLRDTLEEQLGAAQGAQVFVRMASNLDPADRQVACAVLFRATAPGTK